MKIYSSKKAALNNISVTNYKIGLYCTGQYKTTIKTMDVTNRDIKALYKSYRNDDNGSYVMVHYIREVK